MDYRTKYPITWKRFEDGEIIGSMMTVSTSFKNYFVTICRTVERLIMSGIDIHTTFILCPVYGSDFEFGVGGTEHEYEFEDDTAYRELGEELGLIIKKSDDMKNYKVGQNVWGRRKYTGYVIPIENTKFLSRKEKEMIMPSISTAPDKYSKDKIHCLVYGSIEAVLEKMNYGSIIEVFDNTDGIIGVGFQPLAFLIETCEKVRYTPTTSKWKTNASTKSPKRNWRTKSPKRNWRTKSPKKTWDTSVVRKTRRKSPRKSTSRRRRRR